VNSIGVHVAIHQEFGIARLAALLRGNGSGNGSGSGSGSGVALDRSQPASQMCICSSCLCDAIYDYTL
jgi:hypothetical protein